MAPVTALDPRLPRQQSTPPPSIAPVPSRYPVVERIDHRRVAEMPTAAGAIDHDPVFVDQPIGQGQNRASSDAPESGQASTISGVASIIAAAALRTPGRRRGPDPPLTHGGDDATPRSASNSAYTHSQDTLPQSHPMRQLLEGAGTGHDQPEGGSRWSLRIMSRLPSIGIDREISVTSDAKRYEPPGTESRHHRSWRSRRGAGRPVRAHRPAASTFSSRSWRSSRLCSASRSRVVS